MRILDRYVVSRFLWNFVALFGALYLFGVAVDVVISTSKFLEAADIAVRDGRAGTRLTGFVIMLLDFHGPRVFSSSSSWSAWSASARWGSRSRRCTRRANSPR